MAVNKTGVGGILRDELKKGEARLHGDYAQTPKYSLDSSDTDRMARFFISSTLVSALTKYYGNGSKTNYLINSLSNLGYFDFLLTNISDASQDRYQLTETMGENYVLYGFNKAPEILQCSGILKNTQQDDWKVQFLELFKKIGGISSLAKFFQYEGKNVANYLTFKYDSVYKRGAILNVTHSLSATSEMDISFSFSFIVTKTIDFKQISGNSIELNDGVEAQIIEGTTSQIRTITQSGLATLTPASTSNNLALSKTKLKSTQDSITSGKTTVADAGTSTSNTGS